MSSSSVRASLGRIRQAFIRIPRNVFANRLYIKVGNAFYVYSRSQSKRVVNESSKTSSIKIRESVRVYVLARIPSPSRAEAVEHYPQVVVIPHLGRFGNAVKEFVGAVAVAQALGIKHLFLLGRSIFTIGGELAIPESGRASGDIRFWFNPEAGTVPLFSQVILWSSSHFTLTAGNYNSSWKASNQVLGLSSRRPSDPDFAIHLRGGDVFGPRDTRNYGQPPLSFYEKVLEHSNPAGVHIVYQDDRNLVLKPLEKLCERLGIHCTLQSGALKDDIETLLAAQTLVAGRGTFIPAVAGLSKILRRVYFFEDKFNIGPPRSGLEIYRVRDRVGEYAERVLRGNWENRPDQRELMLSYPATHLTLERLNET